MGLDWTPSGKFCASSAHMGWAAAYCLAFPPNYYPYHLTTIVFVVWVIVKEYVLDISLLQPLVEYLINKGIPKPLVQWLALEKDSIVGTTLDAVTYTLGYLVGLICIWNHLVALIAAAIGVFILAWLDYHRFLPETSYPYD